MFGVVPKSIWSRTNPADENNMCSWAMRSLLVEDGDRLILIDNGIGEKQSEKFFSYYYLHGDDSLEKSLAAHGFGFDDITDVFLTHLHFDHCGGGVKWNKDRTSYEATFKNATYWSHSSHWDWAINPNSREKASFLKENLLPMQEFGQLKFADKDGWDGFDYITVNGHTEAQMLPKINYNGKTVVFMADLIPSVGHIPLAYVMGYDTRPLLTLEEKGRFLTEAVENDYVMFLEHDSVNECCILKDTEKGPRLGEAMPFSNIG